jgi:hypothetical protein
LAIDLKVVRLPLNDAREILRAVTGRIDGSSPPRPRSSN